jgi:hypothetical protein
MKTLDFFKQPYPYEPPTWKSTLRLALGIGGFIALFLLIFQPFGLDIIPQNFKPWMISAYGGITFLVIIIYQKGIKSIFQNYFKEQGWTTGKEMIKNLTILLLIAIGNFYYTYWIGGIRSTFLGFIFLFFATVLVGLFPIIALIFINYTKILKRNLKEAQKLDATLQTKHKETTTSSLTINSQYKEESLTLSKNQLMWISAADNYIEICYLENGKLQKKLIRNNLSTMERELKSHGILRTHRSYLINMHKASHIEGNAQGYRISLDDFHETLPVSRKYAPSITSWMKEQLDIGP